MPWPDRYIDVTAASSTERGSGIKRKERELPSHADDEDYSGKHEAFQDEAQELLDDDFLSEFTPEKLVERQRRAYGQPPENLSPAEIEEILAGIPDPLDSSPETAAPEPVVPAADSDAVGAEAAGSKNVQAGVEERSKNVLVSQSKNVRARQRRKPSKDAEMIAKMRGFQIGDDSPTPTSSVSYPLPSTSLAIKAPESSLLTSANDNLIPVWPLTGNDVKAFSASVALQISEMPAVAFTFNLTPDAIEKALGRSAGFLDCLKRSFDAELKGRLPGLALAYWFAIDVDDNGRLHIHGAFAADPAWHSAIREAMKEAWDEWDGLGKHKQLLFQSPCDDGWATYGMRNQRAVAKIIGPRTFTINHPLRRDAEWVYTEIRRIMREAPRT